LFVNAGQGRDGTLACIAADMADALNEVPPFVG
jgi:hypothetical protein